MANSYAQDNLIGQSNAFLEVLEHVSLVAPLSKPVLVIGERGTGKELFAERLHYLSARWEKSFIKLNCASLSDTLLESELFGHESGSFTGAKGKHQGRFERADKGTLFLDELANTSLLIQEKLLRVIEYGEFERVGGSKAIHTDVRLICAANEDLPTLAQEGKFRADLLDRLAFDVITLPPLRSRKEDIMPLVEYFGVSMARQLSLPLFTGFSAHGIEQLLEYSWPGNIRELKNVVERSVYRNGLSDKAIDEVILDPFESPFRPLSKAVRPSQTCDSEPAKLEIKELSLADTPHKRDNSSSGGVKVSFPISLKSHCEQFEKDVIQQALAQGQFNQKKTAALLGLSYHQLRGILKKYHLLDKS